MLREAGREPWPRETSGERITVVDNGRGVPADRHVSRPSATEVVLTVLHASGKLDGDSYKVGLQASARITSTSNGRRPAAAVAIQQEQVPAARAQPWGSAPS